MFFPESEHFQLKKNQESECREMIFGIITQVLHFYLSKNYSTTKQDILWMWIPHTHTLKPAQCKELCKNYDAIRNYYGWIQPINMITDPFNFMCSLISSVLTVV